MVGEGSARRDGADTVHVSGRRPAAAVGAGRPAVLLVDDDAAIRELLHEVLEGDGRLVVTGEAADGDMAVEAAARLQPDAIVLDHQMPRRSGLDALPDLRRAAPGAVVVMLSGAPGADLERRAADAGAHACFRKGAGMVALLDAVLGLVARDAPAH
jgi:chemotaxis response regulator CheB